jgi:hypothetical protein
MILHETNYSVCRRENQLYQPTEHNRDCGTSGGDDQVNFGFLKTEQCGNSCTKSNDKQDDSQHNQAIHDSDPPQNVHYYFITDTHLIHYSTIFFQCQEL